VQFAAKVTQNRGAVSEADLKAVKAAGYSDAELVEIVAHVALNTLTNYINEVFKTEVDFPVVQAKRAA
jgi:alkylhydroperoxidase family enzyme